MIQDILVFVIIAAALGYFVWSVSGRRKKRRPASCGDCTACSCELAELKKECEAKKK